jgi:thioredoxin 1
MEIVTRLLIALALAGLGLLAYTAWNRWQFFRLRAPAAGDRRAAPGLEAWQSGRPAILYFTTPECAPCRTMQRPALERVRAELEARIQVIEIDASVQTAAADHWGVLSVPTTFVLDAGGAPQHVNHGVAGAQKLLRQLESVWGAGPKDKGSRPKALVPNP